ncbi:hypothetical protein ACOSQ2_005212 [Xanthoceras sorbifolium]
MYHPDNCEVDNGDSDSDTDVVANVDTTTSGTKKMNFDIGSTSTSAAIRKLNFVFSFFKILLWMLLLHLGDIVASGRVNTSTQFSRSTSRTETVAKPSSQPRIQNAPMFDSQHETHHNMTNQI